MPPHRHPDRNLRHLHHALPQHVRHQADRIAREMKTSHLPPLLRYTPLRQIQSRFPSMNEEQLAELIFYILAEAEKLDELASLGETESLRLQMAMDRYSKFMSTLSNLLKKAADTSSTIVQNIK